MNIDIKNVAFLLSIVILKCCSCLAISTNAFAESFLSKDTLNQPLFLTPYLDSGDIKTGRFLSIVGQLPNAPTTVPSYSGFITVNKEYNSNLFFWFFPALNKNVSAPFILWLQGGPGATDLMGIFIEHGPYILYFNTTAGLREHTWAKEFHVLYVDNPVGTGFSFTDNEKGYSTNQDQITENLYEFLRQFFEVYYEYSHNDLYICGESYGGKHVPYLGYKIHIDGSPVKGIQFKGIAIGNGIIDIHGINGLPNLHYQLGIVDSKQASHMAEHLRSVEQHAQRGETLQALEDYDKFYGYFTEISGYEFFYDFLVTKQPDDYSYYSDYIQSPQSRTAIHVGNLPLHGEETVAHYLSNDIFGSSPKYKLAVLMGEYKVLLYFGQLDLVIPYAPSENVIRNMTWKYAEEYKAADRKIWRLDDDVAGYVTSAGNFSLALVRNAGHLVPREQPKAALDLITKFIKNIQLTD